MSERTTLKQGSCTWDMGQYYASQPQPLGKMARRGRDTQFILLTDGRSNPRCRNVPNGAIESITTEYGGVQSKQESANEMRRYVRTRSHASQREKKKPTSSRAPGSDGQWGGMRKRKRLQDEQGSKLEVSNTQSTDGKAVAVHFLRGGAVFLQIQNTGDSQQAAFGIRFSTHGSLRRYHGPFHVLPGQMLTRLNPKDEHRNCKGFQMNAGRGRGRMRATVSQSKGQGYAAPRFLASGLDGLSGLALLPSYSTFNAKDGGLWIGYLAAGTPLRAHVAFGRPPTYLQVFSSNIKEEGE
ncbi:uncharacterized protein SPSK_03439 [Sporothrix schenckii 1099-18]|uniref:Uncharacterized protein n=1 Tax=Sporothrix schenckii 1099-18 TaxID=1397361 RepID=A0A0F2M2Y4_SPOSC|nr:uncharacterized protein SPSK_03439 [Sporothrix schenckii 1099-18]KJR82496.1 hypothetical protein SPSK_03439 [Sporothrix schenckii 1099-18]